ncbi:MAG: winged helix-turn-helix domain-containing protein [Planctomycetes bacterium]|nr:winged helix-turn-helix domain-containing protein [Planctomycetota bacterium]MBI3847418.1 winged helix-turn-helix domain-containing protein [Planctomycetota bacterium]
MTPLGNQIGQTAGVVWQYLNKNKEATPDKIKKETKVSDELLHQAIGWLAREDKIQFLPAGKYVKISLKHGV